MDSIDITSPEFSLDIPNITDVSNSIDTTNYIYIGIIFLVLTIGFLLYKFFNNKNKRVTFQDNNNLNDSYDTGMCKR